MAKPHLETAHAFWKDLVTPSDTVIDATCGNGYDTLLLSQLAEKVYSIDIQQQAITSAQSKLTEELRKKVVFLHCCHSLFPAEIRPASVKLIVYNLGYLPGGNKSQTTQVETTLLSLNRALSLVQPGGAVSITCYPGHAEGKREEEAIQEWIASLDSKWTFQHHRWLSRLHAPSLIIITEMQPKAD